MPTIDPAYCTEEDLIRFLSQHGVDSFGGEGGTVDDAIDQATEEINYYCQRYTAAALATSVLVNRWAVRMAAYFLAGTRANPEPNSLVEEFNRIIDRLIEIRSGVGQIPGLAMRADLSPGFSNLRVDRRYIYRKQRVTPNSTQAASTIQQDQIPYLPVVNE